MGELITSLQWYDSIPLPMGMLEKFVYRHGCAYEQAPRLPRGVRMGKQGSCFANAYRLAMRGVGQYCEGYGYRPNLIPVHHAWVIVDGQAVDNTWRKAIVKDCEGPCEYYGVTFDNVTLAKHVARTGIYGILAPGEMLNIPLLRDMDAPFIEAAIAAIIAQKNRTRALDPST